MKRALLALALLALPLAAEAQQIRISLNITSSPSPYLSDWTTRRETAILTIVNPDTRSHEVKLRARVSTNGELRAETNLEKVPVFTVRPGINTFYGEDLVPASAVKFNGDVGTRVLRTGRLPSGTYSFCVQVHDASTLAPLGREECRPMTIRSFQPIRLIAPSDRAKVPPPRIRPTFQWSPVTLKYSARQRYQVNVMEVRDGQSPSQAFRANRPILDRSIDLATRLLWPSDVQIDTPMTYVWSVRALDDAGNPLGESEGGWSTPASFSVGMPDKWNGNPLSLSDGNPATETLSSDTRPRFDSTSDDTDFRKEFESLKNITTNRESLRAHELDDLAGLMAADSLPHYVLQRLLKRFYALNAGDLETVLVKLRELNRKRLAALGQSVEHLLKNEPAVRKACNELNRISLERYKLPFHLAALRGNTDSFEDIVARAGVERSDVPDSAGRSSAGQSRAAGPACPEEFFPRYVGYNTKQFWKQRAAHSMRVVYRYQDPSCNYRHGEFSGNVQHWVTYNPSIMAMVYSNGWGGYLAASDRAFFYKWWTLPIYGLSPFSCMIGLRARL